MLQTILTMSLLVRCEAFSYDGKSAQKLQTSDLFLGIDLDQSEGESCKGLTKVCGGGLSCSTLTGKCVPYGMRNQPCGGSDGEISCISDYWCLLGIGSGYTCSSGAQGEACSAQNWPHTCNGGLSCVSTGICSGDAGPKAACGSSAGGVDCQGGYWCSTGIGSGYTCSSGKKGEACSAAIGEESCGEGLACLSDGMCGTNAGQGEACGSSAGNVNCGAGYWCIKSKCVSTLDIAVDFVQKATADVESAAVTTAGLVAKVRADIGKVLEETGKVIGEQIIGVIKLAVAVAGCITPGSVNELNNCEMAGKAIFKTAVCLNNIGNCVDKMVTSYWDKCRTADSVATCLVSGSLVVAINVMAAVATGGSSTAADEADVAGLATDSGDGVANSEASGNYRASFLRAYDENSESEINDWIDINFDREEQSTDGCRRRRLLDGTGPCSITKAINAKDWVPVMSKDKFSKIITDEEAKALDPTTKAGAIAAKAATKEVTYLQNYVTRLEKIYKSLKDLKAEGSDEEYNNIIQKGFKDFWETDNNQADFDRFRKWSLKTLDKVTEDSKLNFQVETMKFNSKAYELLDPGTKKLIDTNRYITSKMQLKFPKEFDPNAPRSFPERVFSKGKYIWVYNGFVFKR